MNDTANLALAERVTSLSSAALANVLEQSVDCVKFVGLDGEIQYMNYNGQCAMEIEDVADIVGRDWASLWPEESRDAILGSMRAAADGETSRFRAFCPTAKGSARWWDVTVSAVTDSAGRHAGYLSISRDATDNENAREALAIAVAEMRHRLKNTYAMIGSLLVSLARGNDAHELFASEMADRLTGLSAAQALFSTHDAPCELDRLIDALVVPFDSPACRVTIDELPSATVDQGQADAVALVIGELAVNSAKHGAIGHGGAVRIAARVADNVLTVLWIERAHHKVEQHDRQGGQGLRLMERIMRARRGSIDIEWADEGLIATLTLALG